MLFVIPAVRITINIKLVEINLSCESRSTCCLIWRVCCGSTLSLVQFEFSLFYPRYQTLPKTKKKWKIKFEPRMKLKHNILKTSEEESFLNLKAVIWEAVPKVIT